MICLVAVRSAAPERHRSSALTLISRGLLHFVPAHAYTRTVRSLERSHRRMNCFFLYIYRSWGVSLYWFLLAVMERVKVSAAWCGSQSASVFFMSNTCIHGSSLAVEHFRFESRHCISFIASFSFARFLSNSHWEKSGERLWYECNGTHGSCSRHG
jgi:hypothetical protein